LPATVAWILIGGKRLLFLTRSLNRGVPESRPPEITLPAEETPAAPPLTGAFEPAFTQAFQRVDRLKGSHNFVSLVDLRRELPVSREAFDGGLRSLRRAGKYSLSAAEGRHGISPEERDAGIEEEGTLLLYVSQIAT
jgi:hypothetical protein